MKSNREKAFGGTFRKPCFIGMQKLQNVNIKNKVQKQKQIK